MKTLLIALFALTSLAYADSDSLKSQRKVMSCAQDMLEHFAETNGFHKNVILYVDSMFMQMKDYQNDPEALDEITKSCRATIETASGLIEIEHTGDLVYSNVIEGMIHPSALCTKTKLSVKAAALVGVQVSLGGASCEATNGKRFLTFAPEIGGAIGAGGSVTWDETIYNMVSPSFLTTTQDARKTAAFVYAIDFPKTGSKDLEISGAGLGIGYIHTRNVALNFKIIPLTRSFDSLIKQIIH